MAQQKYAKFCHGILRSVFFWQIPSFAQQFDPKISLFLLSLFAHLAQPISLIHLTLLFMNGCFWIPAGKSWMVAIISWCTLDGCCYFLVDSAMSSAICWCCGSNFLYCFLALGGGTTCARSFSTNWVAVGRANSATSKLPRVVQQAAAGQERQGSPPLAPYQEQSYNKNRRFLPCGPQHICAPLYRFQGLALKN